MLTLLDKARRLSSIKLKIFGFNANYTSNTSNNKANASNPNYISFKRGCDNNIKIAINTNNYKTKFSKSKLVCSNGKKLGYLEKTCFVKYLYIKNYNKKTINNTKVSKKETVLATSIAKNNIDSINFVLDSGATIYTRCIKDLFTSIIPTKKYIK
jgi:hypothetical protein